MNKQKAPRVRKNRPSEYSGTSRWRVWRAPPLSKGEVEVYQAQGVKRLEVTGHIDLEAPLDVKLDMVSKMSANPAVPEAPPGMEALCKCPYCLRGP